MYEEWAEASAEEMMMKTMKNGLKHFQPTRNATIVESILTDSQVRNLTAETLHRLVVKSKKICSVQYLSGSVLTGVAVIGSILWLSNRK